MKSKHREPRIEPTPETAAKLQADHIDELFRAGHLRPEHVQASAEIREVYGYWHAAMGRTSSIFSGVIVGGSTFADPIGGMPKRIEGLWRAHTAPWASEMGVRAHPVLHVVVDNWWPLAGPLRAYARNILQRRLWRYAQIAGWAHGYSTKPST